MSGKLLTLPVQICYKMMRKIFFTFIASMLVLQVFAQLNSVSEINERRVHLNRNGMLVLGSWAAANIITGAIASRNTLGQTKYFHQFNMYWNVVNLSLAGLGLYQSYHTGDDTLLNTAIKQQAKVEKVFLINAGLDLAYMATGFLLTNKGNRQDKNSNRLKGYGKSLLLQGAFLFVFDAAMYGIHHNNGKGLHSILNNANITASLSGVGVTVQL